MKLNVTTSIPDNVIIEELQTRSPEKLAGFILKLLVGPWNIIDAETSLLVMDKAATWLKSYYKQHGLPEDSERMTEIKKILNNIGCDENN